MLNQIKTVILNQVKQKNSNQIQTSQVKPNKFLKALTTIKILADLMKLNQFNQTHENTVNFR